MKVTKVVETNGRISDEALARVVDIYRSVELVGGSGVEAVSQAEGFSTRTAARWLARARARGLLEHTDKSTAATARSSVRRPVPSTNGDTPEVIWEDPPPIKAGRPPSVGNDSRTWYERCAPLVAHPKRWARIRTYNLPGKHTSASNNLNNGLLKLPKGRWEFAARTVDGSYHVYGRYLGRKR